MKREPYWALKTRFGKYVQDPDSLSAFRTLLFKTPGQAEFYAAKPENGILDDWQARPVKVFLTMTETPFNTYKR